jgi:hypothetical protein
VEWFRYQAQLVNIKKENSTLVRREFFECIAFYYS